MAESKARRLLDEALKAGEARDYGRAVEILGTLIAEDEAPTEALLFLGRSHHALGETGKAVAAFRAYLRAGGDEAAGSFFLGRSYMAAGRLEEASQCLKRSLEADPDRAAAWALLGAAQLKLRKSKLALSCLEKAVGLAPEDQRIFRGYLNAIFVRACKLLGRGDSDMARQMLSFAIGNGLDGAGPRLWRARAYRELGRFNEALVDCETAIATSPGDASLRWLRAGLLLSSGRENEALSEFEALKEEYPELPGLPSDEATLARLRISVAFNEERWKEAASEALGLLKQAPEDPSLRAIVAESLRNLGQLERSMNHWQRAIEADPQAAEFRLGLATTLYELEDYAGARAQAEKARKLGADPAEADYYSILSAARAGEAPALLIPRLQGLIRSRGADPMAMFALAEALYRTGRPDLASGWFDKVLFLIPRHELALLYRISIAESLEDGPALARSHADYLAAYPDNGKIRKEYVDLLMRGENWDEAARVLEEGLAFGDQGDKSRRILALAYRNAGRYREAAIIYRDLLKASMENAELLLALAFCLERDGKGDYALALLERAPDGAKKGAGPWIVLGLLYERRGKKEKAVDALRTATDLEPKNSRAWKDLGLLYRRMGLVEFSANCLERATSLGAKITAEELGRSSGKARAQPSRKAPSPAPRQAPSSSTREARTRATGDKAGSAFAEDFPRPGRSLDTAPPLAKSKGGASGGKGRDSGASPKGSSPKKAGGTGKKG